MMLRRTIFVLVCLVCGVLALAAGNTDADFGDAAAAIGDYRAAAEFYLRAQAAAGRDANLWQDISLKLGRSRLRGGDIAGARKVLKDWQERFPDGSDLRRKLLESDILINEGSFAEAEEMLGPMLGGKIVSGEFYSQILSMLSYAYFRQHKYELAAENYAVLEKTSVGTVLEFQAWQRRLFALLASSRFDEVRSALENSGKFTKPEQRSEIREIQALYDLETGNLPAFELGMAEILTAETENLSSDFIRYELMRRTAEFYLKSDLSKAADFYRAAFRTAESDVEKRQMLRNLSEVLSKDGKNSEAAETLLKYLDFFPGQPDVMSVVLRAANLFLEAGNDDEALGLYRDILDDPNGQMEHQRQAAHKAAELLLRRDGKGEAVANFRKLINRSTRTQDLYDNYFLLGEFFYNIGDFKEAAAAFKFASGVHNGDAEKAKFWIMNSFLQSGDYPAALGVVDELAASSENSYRKLATYYRALIHEKSGDHTGAQAQYEAYLKENPRGEYAPAATWAVAALAEVAGNYAHATTMFHSYANDFPAAPYPDQALYRAFNAAYFGGDNEAQIAIVNELKTRFPRSEYTIGALFNRADRLCQLQDHTGELAIYEEIGQLIGENGDAELKARLLLDRSGAYRELERKFEEHSLLKLLLDNSPGSASAAEAAYRLGNWHFENSQYQEAVDYYRQALTSADGKLRNVASGKLADSLMEWFSQNSDFTALNEATAIYEEQANNPENSPELRLQSLYKKGLSIELNRSDDDALELYCEVLYRAMAFKGEKIEISAIWPGRALHAAIRLLDRQRNWAAGQKMLRLIDAFEGLNFETGEDFAGLRQSIKNKYQL